MRFNVDRFARVANNGDKTMWVPGQPVVGLHRGSIADVNHPKGVATVNWADGSAPNVLRYMLHYGPGNLPQPDHEVWVLQYGETYMIMAQHVVPDDFITLA